MNSIFERPFIGAYWGARRETKKACAEKVVETLNSLSKWPPLNQWYFCIKELDDPAIPIIVTVEDMIVNLSENINDYDNKIIECLGFSFFAWCGDENSMGGISFSCGAFSDKVANCVNLKLPPLIPPKNAEESNDLREMMEIIIKFWDPESAIVTSDENMRRMKSRPAKAEDGWFIYHKGKGIQCLLPV